MRQGFCFAASGVASLEYEFGGGGEMMRKSGRVKLVPLADFAVEAVVGFVVVVGVLVIAVLLAMPLKCGEHQTQ